MKGKLLFTTFLLASFLYPLIPAYGAGETEKKPAPEEAKKKEAQEAEEAKHRGFFEALYHLNEYKPTWKYLDWGIEERFRFDAYQNLGDVDYGHDDKGSMFRFRTRVWAKLKPLVDYEPLEKTYIYMRWVNEYRAFSNRKESQIPPTRDQAEAEEIIMDNLYLKFEEPWKVPMYLRVGRMDMPKNIMGDNFFFKDFTPGESSRSAFFDGFDVGFWWPPKDRKADHFTMFQILGAYNTDEWYAQINEEEENKRLLKYYDREKWLLFWLTHESKYTLRQKVELFYMPYRLISYHHDDIGNDYRSDLTEPLAVALQGSGYHYAPTLLIHLFGGRLSGEVLPDFFDKRLSYMLQAGWEFGRYGHENLQAYSASAKGKYKIPLPKKLDPLKPYISAGYEVFSGDKEETSRYEGWIWPPTYQSTRKPYGHVIRDIQRSYEGVIPYSNMQAIPVEVGWHPFWDKIKFTHMWAPLWAMERRHMTDPADYGNSTFKGNVLFNEVKWDITKWLSTKLQFEYFKPGNFYYHDGHPADPSWYARYEMVFKF